MTETDVCNLALGRLGEARIMAITDDNAAARACHRYYGPTRDEVLRSHRWNFATARSVLSEVAAPAFGWNHAYQLPADCMRVLEVNGSEHGGGPAWTLESGKLLTDATSVKLVYVKQVTDASKYDPIFCEALSLKLAAKLTTIFRGSSSQLPDLLQEYDRLTAPLARRIDANEGRTKRGLRPTRSGFLAARQTGGGIPWFSSDSSPGQTITLPITAATWDGFHVRLTIGGTVIKLQGVAE